MPEGAPRRSASTRSAAADPPTTGGHVDPDVAAWRLPRHLTGAAVAIVAALVLAGWGLHRWGPLNPDVATRATITDQAADGSALLELTVRNDSATEIVLTDVRITPDGPLPPELAATSLDVGAVQVRSADWPPGALPSTLAPDEEVTLAAGVTLGGCDPGSFTFVRVTATVGVESAWGVHGERSVAAQAFQGLPCPTALPEEIDPPADRQAAVAAITEAYDAVYDPTRPEAERLAGIDDARGVAETTAAVHGGEHADVAAGLRVHVHEVAFRSPTHAWVAYDLGNPVIGRRAGEAHLVDGTWRVARSTVCADLALAGETCPPLAG